MKFLTALLAAAGLLLAASPSSAAWPERPITIIVHFAPGGGSDLLGRLLSAELAPILGQSVVVENRPGANGNVGVTAAARAAPDGYTIIVVSGSALVNPSMGPVPYDFLKDFAPIAYLGASPNVFLTSPTSGIGSIQELIAKAKANPGKINFGSAGVGSVPHMSVELLKQRAGIDMQHVPFSGLAPSVTATIAGTIDFTSVTISGVMGQIESGTVKALAQTAKTPWPGLKDVPTLLQAGIDAESETSQMLLAPAGTPKPIIDRLEKEVVAIMARADVRERMLKAGFAPAPESGELLRARLAREIPQWKQVVEQAGLRKN
jgi:tripartite-type tricarboxylate transporter receptor subunit TctC